ncbi:MAG: hypothetical protein AMXMBFR83_11330 [Phycisphaerae bacterium]
MMNVRWLSASAVWLGGAAWAWANGGPFLVKYPNGDPAAKGVLARLDPDLKPAREERLRVVKEDLRILFVRDGMRMGRAVDAEGKPAEANPLARPPLAVVTAAYAIENPSDQQVSVDFGFPILRGIYVQPWSMMPRPDAQVQLDGKNVQVNILSNSLIYGLIRQRCREAIERAVAADAELSKRVGRVRASSYVRQRAREAVNQAIANDEAVGRAARTDAVLSRLLHRESDAQDPDREATRQALADYLTGTLKWNRESAALMVEYACLDLGPSSGHPHDRSYFGFEFLSTEAGNLTNANLGRLSAIGEQKATQLFAELAARFDPQVKLTYEGIFSAWGGDVRERSVDLSTGELRPREITLDPAMSENDVRNAGFLDPTIYARVDYLSPQPGMTEAEKASCRAILKHLPVVFTFAPMNLLYYQAAFAPRSTHTLTVTYKQYAYLDTRSPSSYQLAYVVHPASLWKDFGPIELEIAVPEGLAVKASVECAPAGVEERELPPDVFSGRREARKQRLALHRTTIHEKTGELFVAVDAKAWQAQPDETKPQKADRTVLDTPQPAAGR